MASNFDTIKFRISGFGAALVVVGALFKILHLPGAGGMLTVGLLTEAGIFVLSALGGPGKDYNWEKVYPELSEGDALQKKRDPKAKEKAKAVVKNQNNVIEELAVMPLIDEGTVSNLKKSIGNLATTSETFSDLGSFTESMGEYTTQLKTSGQNLTAINAAYEEHLIQSKESYDVSKNIVSALKDRAEETQQLKGSLQELNKSIEGLSSIYGGMLSVASGK